jgi:Ca-activated chloride channel family protein
VRYGIVTPYTSYLVTGDDILTEEGRVDAAREQATQAANAPAASSGAGAVDAASAANEMSDAGPANSNGAPAPKASEEYADQVQIIGPRTFVLKDGVWIETTFDPSKMETTKVTFASDEYFQLLADHPDLADAFALGEQVIAISDGVAYEVVS